MPRWENWRANTAFAVASAMVKVPLFSWVSPELPFTTKSLNHACQIAASTSAKLTMRLENSVAAALVTDRLTVIGSIRFT